ncbi:MAG: hypothetical protein RLY86_755 [Pseudomonadota bacterium]
MSFTLSKAFWALAAPGNALLLLLILGLALLAAGRRRAGWVLAGGGAGGLAAIAILPVGYWLLYPLEARFPVRPEPPARVDGIIVLGGAVVPLRTAEWGRPSLSAHAERMTEVVRLLRHNPDARVVFTGGSGSVRFPEEKEAVSASLFWDGMGLDTSRIIFEDQSRNTWENALLSRDLVQPRAGEVWLLVTSASHMPRSVGIFRKVGWEVVPWPVAFQTATRADSRLDLDLSERLEDTTLAVREWIGLVAYHWMGRTDSLFPGPEAVPAAP